MGPRSGEKCVLTRSLAGRKAGKKGGRAVMFGDDGVEIANEEEGGGNEFCECE